MRRTVQSMERASALASLVLPTPGTSSISRWPSASITASASRTVAVLPSITRSMLETMALVIASNSLPDSGLPSSSWVRCEVTPFPFIVASAPPYETPGCAFWLRRCPCCLPPAGNQHGSRLPGRANTARLVDRRRSPSAARRSPSARVTVRAADQKGGHQQGGDEHADGGLQEQRRADVGPPGRWVRGVGPLAGVVVDPVRLKRHVPAPLRA